MLAERGKFFRHMCEQSKAFLDKLAVDRARSPAQTKRQLQQPEPRSAGVGAGAPDDHVSTSEGEEEEEREEGEEEEEEEGKEGKEELPTVLLPSLPLLITTNVFWAELMRNGTAKMEFPALDRLGADHPHDGAHERGERAPLLHGRRCS